MWALKLFNIIKFTVKSTPFILCKIHFVSLTLFPLLKSLSSSLASARSFSAVLSPIPSLVISFHALLTKNNRIAPFITARTFNHLPTEFWVMDWMTHGLMIVDYRQRQPVFAGRNERIAIVSKPKGKVERYSHSGSYRKLYSLVIETKYRISWPKYVSENWLYLFLFYFLKNDRSLCYCLLDKLWFLNKRDCRKHLN